MIDQTSATYENLEESFAEECKAYFRYRFCADAARSEGMSTVADTFDRLARNEEQHARFWFKLLRGEENEVEEDIRAAISAERRKWSELYFKYALQAKDEGNDEAASVFMRVANIEKDHEKKLTALLEMLNGTDKPQFIPGEWVCMACGGVEASSQKPASCPVCGIQGMFMENY